MLDGSLINGAEEIHFMNQQYEIKASKLQKIIHKNFINIKLANMLGSIGVEYNSKTQFISHKDDNNSRHKIKESTSIF